MLVRIYAIAGTPVVGGFPDSATYRQGAAQLTYPFVSLSGHAMRPWTAPLLYAVLPSDGVRSATQVLISVVAWIALATAVALALRDRRLRVAAFAIVLLSSCTTVVIGWDRTIGSESLSISLAVLAFAAWIRFATKASSANAVAVVVATACWSFTKSGTFPVVALSAVIVLVAIVNVRDRKLLGIVGAALVVVALWGAVANARSDRVYERFQGRGMSQFNINFAELLRLEVLHDAGATAWFVQHGMPDPTGLPSYRMARPADTTWEAGDDAFLRAYLHHPDLVAWANSKGQGVYAKYALTHAVELTGRFSKEVRYLVVPPRDAVVYARDTRPVLPIAMQNLLFDTTPGTRSSGGWFPPPPFGDVALLFVACAVLAFVPRRREVSTRLLLVGGATAGMAIVALAVGWVLSPVEIARHAIPASVLLRLSLWVILLGLLDSRLAPVRPEDLRLPD